VKRFAFALSVVLAAVAGLLVPAAAHAGAGASASTSTSAPAGTLTNTSTRQKINFNRDWKFIRSDVAGAQNPGFDDSAWVPVALPHDFDAPYDVGGGAGGASF
jgi:beta-galactosidase